MANAIRALAMDAVEQAKSGHPGMPMGMADVATVLFTRFLEFRPARPDWPDRDRFVLSAGHGSMLLYALLHLTGYADMTLDELRRFRQLGCRTAGHPEYGHALGIETTTGPLGQGIANAVGMALAERMLGARFGDDLVDHYTYVIAGDGCLMEGISHEAIDLAGHLGLARLIVLWDDNRISIDGPTSLSTSIDQPARFAAAGWHVQAVDGHDPEAVAAAIAAARQVRPPVADRLPHRDRLRRAEQAGHGEDPRRAARRRRDRRGARRRSAGRTPPFEVPDAVRAAWRAVAAPRPRRRRRAWERAAAPPRRGAPSSRPRSPASSPDAVFAALADVPARASRRRRPTVATRKASELALAADQRRDRPDGRRLGRPDRLEPHP